MAAIGASGLAHRYLYSAAMRTRYGLRAIHPTIAGLADSFRLRLLPFAKCRYFACAASNW